MTLALTYRTAGAWGAGKGSRLNAVEVDTNFYDLQQAVNALQDNPVLPAEIEDISLTGNVLRVTLSSGTFFDVELPHPAFNPTGNWAPNTDYAANDLFKATDPDTALDGLYYVNRNFTSDSVFLPNAGVGTGGALPFASKLFDIPAAGGGGGTVTVDLGVNTFVSGKPGDGMTSGDTVWGIMADVEMYAPANLAGCRIKLDVVPTTLPYVISIAKNGDIVGTIQWDTNGVNGDAGTFAAPIQLEPGDLFQLLAPSPVDDTAKGLYLVIPFVAGLAPGGGGGGGSS
jgi:hypothetical protein